MDVHLRRRIAIMAVAATAVGELLFPHGTATSADGGVKLATRTVTIEGTRFDPETLDVRVGDSIVWINKDPFPHTATSTTGAFDSHEIAADKSWTFTATKSGTFPYVCAFHPTMKGVIRVSAEKR